KFAPSGPTVILVAGINGAGKTTSIAKLAWLLKNEMKKKVLMCASDTFRAAAVDQLTIWANRIGVEIVKHKMGADPAAVAYDACEAAKSRKIDGTAKGGVVLAIRDQLKLPVKFVGLGETPQDIETFDPARFVEALFGERAAG